MSSAPTFDANLYNLVAQSPVAMTLLTGPDFIIEIANDMALAQWGKKKEDVPKKTVLEAFPELIEQGFEKILNDIYHNGTSFKADEMPLNLIRHGRLEQRVMNFTYQAIKNSKNEVIGIVGVGVDVTELVNSKKIIEESGEKYKSLFTSMDQGFCILEIVYDSNQNPVDYKFLEINPLFESHSGIKAAQGRTVKELVPNIEQKWIDTYAKVARTGEAERFTAPSAALDRWFDVHAFRVGAQGSNKVAALFSDITAKRRAEIALKESERRFRDLADQSPMMIFIIEPDENATISYWNRAWLDYTGQTFEEALGRAWNGIVHADDIPTVMDIYVPAFSNRESYYIPAIRLKRHDGEYRWHMFKANPRYVDGQFIGFVGVGFDIHERKITEEEQLTFAQKLEALVEVRTQELQRSNDDLQQFAHVASHDLKEPVRKILTFCNIIKEANTIPENKTFLKNLNKIENSAERLRNMIEGVLSYSSISNEQAPLEQTDLNDTLTEVKMDLDLMISDKKAEINFSKLPVIEGAAVLLHQLFYNLVYNSLKFAKENVPPQITIESKFINVHNMKYVEISLSDNGIGFDDASANKIFETFTRLHAKHVYEGTGLGLALCRKIVERHRGTITATGTQGIGATFTITLPLKQPEGFK